MAPIHSPPASGAVERIHDTQNASARSTTDHFPAGGDLRNRVLHAVEHAAHYLPTQGPIGVFVHHNTLHAYEEMPFEEAAVAGSRVLGCQPFFSEGRFHQELQAGRILASDIEATLRENLGAGTDVPVHPLGTRWELRRAMMLYPLRTGTTAELKWFIAETDALKRVRSDVPAELRRRLVDETRDWIASQPVPSEPRDEHGFSLPRLISAHLRRTRTHSITEWRGDVWEAFTLEALWRLCREGARSFQSSAHERRSPIRHCELLRDATGEDCDIAVHALLTRFCAAFLDQGMATFTLPDRDEGFMRSFCTLYSGGRIASQRWLAGLPAELRRLEATGFDAVRSIADSLHLLGVSDEDWDTYISATLLALPGWAGMVRQLETRTDEVACPARAGSLVEFLAIRLVLERLKLAHVARRMLGYAGPLSELKTALRDDHHRRHGAGTDQRAFSLFQICQALGCSPRHLDGLAPADWKHLWAEFEAFGGIQRRLLFQLAYERRFRVQTLDAVSARVRRPPVKPANPSLQVVCCIDDREESLRRHLEELSAEVETFGTAGFFGVAMYHRGVGEAHFAALCPVVVKPTHWVEEDVVTPFIESQQRRNQVRRTIGTASHGFYVHSRSFFAGALLTAGLGLLATVPLVARVLFPRLTGWLRRKSGSVFKPEAQTTLDVEAPADPLPHQNGRSFGFSVVEMAAIVEKVLREIGLTTGFAPLVFVFGHGSSSLNNPHESAYNCGACGGQRGGPNARAFAQMANDPRVREILSHRGLSIPPQTFFIGGYHNTCDDSLSFFDVQKIPRFRRDSFHQACELLQQARERNAHERCRLFESAPLDLTPEQALRHVEERSEDLSQTRPEYNHSTNAICLVGRRERFRGLFLDRRAFLVSYDPLHDDPEHGILTRILLPVFPVCAGINLEYYFSTVDPNGFGCGTKLPHNIAALLGVMDGHASDLRTGLSLQMVELHEPLRLLFVIESTREAMLKIIERNAGIGLLCRNRWVHLTLIDPASERISVYRDGAFEDYAPERDDIPCAATSAEWYGGRRGHLEFARIAEA
jgi:uncharacterized protein